MRMGVGVPPGCPPHLRGLHTHLSSSEDTPDFSPTHPAHGVLMCPPSDPSPEWNHSEGIECSTEQPALHRKDASQPQVRTGEPTGHQAAEHPMVFDSATKALLKWHLVRTRCLVYCTFEFPPSGCIASLIKFTDGAMWQMQTHVLEGL